MKIHLYKEDGYSLWVLSRRLPEVLAKLRDKTDPYDPTIRIFYRPSFGRLSDSPTGESKQFGEFDILIGTPECVYAIESKLEKCGELNRRTKVLTLEPRQVRRHDIFRTYRSLWQKYRPMDWNHFRFVALNEFRNTHRGWTMADERNELAQNAEFILRQLQDCGEKMQDTILLFHRRDETPIFTNGQGFTCISM